MAVEEVRPAGSGTLQSEPQIMVRMREIEERLNQLGRTQTEAPRFDMTFVSDVLIALAIFALTVGLFLAQVPIVGDPCALLLGPMVGLVLALKHRPPR
jgi:hypothetical protein